MKKKKLIKWMFKNVTVEFESREEQPFGKTCECTFLRVYSGDFYFRNSMLVKY